MIGIELCTGCEGFRFLFNCTTSVLKREALTTALCPPIQNSDTTRKTNFFARTQARHSNNWTCLAGSGCGYHATHCHGNQSHRWCQGQPWEMESDLNVEQLYTPNKLLGVLFPPPGSRPWDLSGANTGWTPRSNFLSPLACCPIHTHHMDVVSQAKARFRPLRPFHTHTHTHTHTHIEQEQSRRQISPCLQLWSAASVGTSICVKLPSVSV